MLAFMSAIGLKHKKTENIILGLLHFKKLFDQRVVNLDEALLANSAIFNFGSFIRVNNGITVFC